MKETNDLEPQQYQQLYWEEDVPLFDVRKSVLRKMVYLGCFLCLLFIMAGLIIKFPDQVELPFVIKSDESEDIYRFASSIYVLEKYVKLQDSVTKGQQLVKITSAEIVAHINNYEEARQNLLNYNQGKRLSISSQKEIIANKMSQNKNNIERIKYERIALENTWKTNITRAQFANDDAEKRYEIYKKLYNDGVISKFELTNHENEKIRAADSLNMIKQDYAKAKSNLEISANLYTLDYYSTSEELKKTALDSRYDSVSLTNQFMLAKNKISNIYGDFEISGGSLILKSNEKGSVSYIFDGDKEVVAGAILIKLMLRNKEMYASVKSPPSLIGKIDKNKKVVLKVASFPFYEWGTVKAQVDNLSLTPDESGNYSVKISLNENNNKLLPLLRIGMNGNATIILEEKTFYYYFFRRAKKAYYNTVSTY